MSKEQLLKLLMRRAEQRRPKIDDKLLYKCSVCNRCCKSEFYLKIHMRCHERHKTGLYTCTICHCNFTNKATLSSHLLNVHSKQNLNTLSNNVADLPHCVCCNVSFNSLLDLKRHSMSTFSQFPSLSQWMKRRRHLINRQNNYEGNNAKPCKDSASSHFSNLSVNSSVVASSYQSSNLEMSSLSNNVSSVKNKTVPSDVSRAKRGRSRGTSSRGRGTSSRGRSTKKTSNIQPASNSSRKLRAIRPKLPVLIPVGKGISISGNIIGADYKGYDPLKNQSVGVGPCEDESDSSLADNDFMSLLNSAFQEDSSEEDSEQSFSLDSDHQSGEMKTDYLNIIFGGQKNEFSKALGHSKSDEKNPETMEREMMRLLLHTYSFVERASGVFKCVPCQIIYSSETKLLDHLQAHLCLVCGTPFELKDELVYHAHEHSFQTCKPKYDLSFIKDMFEKYTTILDDGKMFTCKVCPKHFAQRSCFFIHMYSHAQNLFEKSGPLTQKRSSDRNSDRERSYHCPHCSKSFFSSKNLKGHMETHEETQKFLCSICGRGFRRKRALLNHLVVHSKKGEGQDVNIPQEIMNLRRKVKPKIKSPPSENYEKQLPSTSGSFVVAACFTPNKLLPDKKLVEPKSEDMRERSFSCAICNKKFFSNRNLRGHMEIHNPQKKYSCSICPRSFRRKQTMLRHVATHE